MTEMWFSFTDNKFLKSYDSPQEQTVVIQKRHNEKGKVKSLCLIKHHTREAYGGRRIASLFLIWALDGVNDELHALAISTLVKWTLGPVN